MTHVSSVVGATLLYRYVFHGLIMQVTPDTLSSADCETTEPP